MRFREAKDVVILPAHALLKATLPLPEVFHSLFFHGLGLGCHAYYLAPGSHVRRTLANFCRTLNRRDPWSIYRHMVIKVRQTGMAYGRLLRDGGAACARSISFAPGSAERCERARALYGSAIVVAPHCLGSMLSSAGFARRFPTAVLIREPKSERRREITREYFDKLGPEGIFVRQQTSVGVTRRIVRALRDEQFVIGSTDVARKLDDTIPAEVFGSLVPLPAWPARLSARLGVPIVPVFTRVERGGIVIECGEPCLETDEHLSTGRWARYFEQRIRESPADWVYMFDKHWARVFAASPERPPTMPAAERGVVNRAAPRR